MPSRVHSRDLLWDTRPRSTAWWVGASLSLYSLPAQMITEGKLYTGSSDGTLRVWNAKDVSEELL